MTIIGILLIGSGVAICTAGYYGTYSTANITDPSEIAHFSSVYYEASTNIQMKLLIYLGPILMSFGVFSIVISCVIVCEARDAIIHIMEKGLQENIITPSEDNENRSTPSRPTADQDFENCKHGTVVCNTRKNSTLMSQEFKFKHRKRSYSINNVSTLPSSVRIDENMTFEFFSTDKKMSSTKYTVTSWNSRCSCPFLAAEMNARLTY